MIWLVRYCDGKIFSRSCRFGFGSMVYELRLLTNIDLEDPLPIAPVLLPVVCGSNVHVKCHKLGAFYPKRQLKALCTGVQSGRGQT